MTGRSRTTLALVVAVSLVLGFVAGLWWHDSRTDTGWLHERARLGDRVVSVEHDGWVYGARESVPQWRDGEGTWHDGATIRPTVAVDCA